MPASNTSSVSPKSWEEISQCFWLFLLDPFTPGDNWPTYFPPLFFFLFCFFSIFFCFSFFFVSSFRNLIFFHPASLICFSFFFHLWILLQLAFLTEWWNNFPLFFSKILYHFFFFGSLHSFSLFFHFCFYLHLSTLASVPFHYLSSFSSFLATHIFWKAAW